MAKLIRRPRTHRFAAVTAMILPLLLMAILLGSCASEPEQGQRDAVGAAAEEAAGSELPQASESREPGTSADGADAVQQAAAGGICDRHEHIQREILWTLDKDDCADVSDGDLASITGQLDLADHYTFTALEADDLLGLTSVERLFINVNVDQVPLGIFDDLASLRELQIYHHTYGDRDHTVILPNGLFESLTNLEMLYVGIVPTEPGLFDPLRNLTRLAIGHTTSTTLPQGIFDRLHSLEELYVGHTDLNTVHPGIFDELQSLKVLNLGDNALTEVPAGLFDSLGQLEWLSLRENQLTSLPAGIFDNLQNLEVLWLWGNPLTELPPELFGGLSSLEDLRY